jgi:hypothetical protein
MKLLSLALLITFFDSPSANAATFTNIVDFSLSNGPVSVLVTGNIVTNCSVCTLTSGPMSDIVSFSFSVTGSLTDTISGPSSFSGPFVVAPSPLSVAGGKVLYDPSASGFDQFMVYNSAMVVTDQVVFGQNYIDVQVGDTDITFPQTPIPATLLLFGSGLGALGLFGWRRKRKNGAAIATV